MRKLLVFLCTLLLVFGILGSSEAFYMNFEEGLGNDGGNIVGIPGVTFTDSGGLAWIYSDITTGGYNARSIDTGMGDGAYQMYGYCIAWLGTEGDWGRIDFDDQNGTWFQTGVTSFTPFYLEAYDASDNLLDSDYLPAGNLNGDDMAWLRVDALPGTTIAYVMLYDEGNLWIVDEMTGDMAGGVPVPEPATMLLLGAGLIGLAGLGRRKLFKRG